jgi:hypothetical protein
LFPQVRLFLVVLFFLIRSALIDLARAQIGFAHAQIGFARALKPLKSVKMAFFCRYWRLLRLRKEAFHFLSLRLLLKRRD